MLMADLDATKFWVTWCGGERDVPSRLQGSSIIAGGVQVKQVDWCNGSGLAVAVDDGGGGLVSHFGKGDIVAGL